MQAAGTIRPRYFESTARASVIRSVVMCSLVGLLGLFPGPAIADTASEPGAPSGSEPTAELEGQLKALHAKSDFPGFAVAIVDREHGILYEKGFGWADRENRKPFIAQTVMNIGSVSKTFIGVALMQAVEKGQIDLDAPIDRYLGFKARNPRFPDKPMTLRHLATHTSGVTDRESIYRQAYSEGMEPSMELGDYLTQYLDPEGRMYDRRNFGKRPPGEVYEYSNIGAALAAFVLEKALGRSFDLLTTESILKPLGMHDSGWSYGDIELDSHAVLYDGNDIVEPYTLVTYPDGGLRTSVSSLGRYLTAMLGGGAVEGSRILTETSVAAMIAPQFDPRDPPKDWGEKNSGIFWSLDKKGLIGHTGGDPGISSVMAFDPKSGRGWVFITNTELNKKTAGQFREIWSLLKATP